MGARDIPLAMNTLPKKAHSLKPLERHKMCAVLSFERAQEDNMGPKNMHSSSGWEVTNRTLPLKYLLHFRELYHNSSIDMTITRAIQAGSTELN